MPPRSALAGGGEPATVHRKPVRLPEAQSAAGLAPSPSPGGSLVDALHLASGQRNSARFVLHPQQAHSSKEGRPSLAKWQHLQDPLRTAGLQAGGKGRAGYCAWLGGWGRSGVKACYENGRGESKGQQAPPPAPLRRPQRPRAGLRCLARKKRGGLVPRTPATSECPLTGVRKWQAVRCSKPSPGASSGRSLGA